MNDRPDHAAAVRATLARLSPADLLQRLGRRGVRQGPQIATLCPAHDEKTPSCMVRERDGGIVWHCFGCGAGGDALAFVAAVERLDIRRDFRRVLVEAALVAGDPGLAVEIDAVVATAPRPARAPCPPVAPTEPEPAPLSDADFAAIVRPLLHVGRLDDSEIARDVTTYLGGRGLLDAARAEGWGALVAAPYSDEVAKMLRDVFGDLAERSGLLRGEHVAWPAHRLLIPWRDPSGRVHTLQRRLIVEARAGLPKYVFPAGCQARWPYGVDRLAEARSSVSIVLVEGAIDALAMRELQRRHDVNRIVLGIPGVSAWRDEWTALMRGRRVSVAFDRDEAGDRAALVVGERLRGVASELLRERPPKNAHDWADLLTSERKRAS